MARAFRRRIILPGVPTAIPPGAGLSQAEAMLFRAWAFAIPHELYEARDVSARDAHFDEHAFLYPVPEELFWKDEGRKRMFV